MAELYRRSLDLGIRGAVDWYGAIWRRDLVLPLVAGSHVFVSASRFEGMPISILEAMAVGLPMVLSDIPPHREVAGEGATYFSPDRPRELADRLGELAADPELVERLRAASAARARQVDPDRGVDAHLDVYRTAVAR
jgi:glycosyltransferase involved in cell wall biosynthesis